MQIELKQKWLNLLNELKADLTIGENIFQELITAHTNVSRHYHNLDRVWHLLTLADSIREMAECFSAIELAAWFHDYVYDSPAQDNEIKSAIYATQTLTRLNLDPYLIDLVKQIILSTQRHQPLLNSIDNLLFLDLDLSILGVTGDRFLMHSLMGETPTLDSSFNGGNPRNGLRCGRSVLSRKTALHRYLQYAQAIRKEYSWLGDAYG